MQKKLLEAALFMAPKPLDLNDLAKIAGVSSLGYVKNILHELQKDYSEKGIEIVNTPQGWQMQVKQELLSKVSHLAPHSDISEGSKRTLALVVYREPINQADVIKIQGNKAYAYIKDLVKRGLIKTEKRGRTRMLKLTQEFERYFGEEKEKVKEAVKAEFEKIGLGKFMKKEQAPESAVGAGTGGEVPGAPGPTLEEPGMEKPEMPRQEARKPAAKKAKPAKKQEARKAEKKEVPLDEGSIPASEGELVF